MALSITPLYAAPLVALLVVLSFRVIFRRVSARISLGDGGDQALLARMRAQANFAEYVPLALLLLAIAELSDGPPWVLHLIGSTLLAGRLLHAWSIGFRGPMAARQAGMILTFTALVIGALVPLF